MRPTGECGSSKLDLFTRLAESGKPFSAVTGSCTVEAVPARLFPARSRVPLNSASVSKGEELGEGVRSHPRSGKMAPLEATSERTDTGARRDANIDEAPGALNDVCVRLVTG
mmetsp:Transcript_10646/g.29502  ORF Transcript_10646/g.29502 Transcript_10646/m.29502 type:complete len:112 (-) Transcript_10646:228-563(-)